ncbi:MAG: hypothetical protein CMN60_20620 [Sphingobium sp.]|nr:hypothetical protein [Sphingobium sp.]MBS50051.1 hypothetical protein [Sphingobium sp.]|tara:strand:+ start:68959 stop:69624 length:666 start_codon:yes stop_codon:yes gene_type:complete
MQTITKHLAKCANTGTKYVVLWHRVPLTPNTYDNEHALVCPFESLTAPYDTEMMTFVRSTAGQQANDVATYLGSRDCVFSTNKGNVLKTLQDYGYIKKVPVDTVVMILNDAKSIGLRELNAKMHGDDIGAAEAVAELAQAGKVENIQESVTQADNTTAPTTGSSGTEFELTTVVEQYTAKSDARVIIEMARDLEKAGKELRKRAYELEPDLRKGGKRASTR